MMVENNQILNDTILQGLDDTLVKSFGAAYTNRHDAIWRDIVKFMNNQLMLAISSESIVLSKHFMNLPSRFFQICLEQEYQTEEILMLLSAGYDDVKYFLPAKVESTESYASSVTLYYYQGVASFYFQTLKLKSNELLETAIADFNKLQDSRGISNFQHEFNKVQKQINNKVDADSLQLSLELRFIRQLSHRRIGLAMQSWSMYLLSIKKMDQERSGKILSKIKLTYGTTLEVLTDAVYIRKNAYTGYLGISWWDHTVRKPGRSYSPPDPNQWIIFGTCFNLLNNSYLNINIEEIPENDDYLFLMEGIKDCLSKIENDWDTWAPLLGARTADATVEGETEVFLEDFKSKRRIIVNLFGRLKNRQQAIKDFKIADQTLDVAKVDEYKRRAGDQWKSNIRAPSYFDHFKNLTTHTELSGLEVLGKRYLLKGFKMMFVDKDYQQIYGSADIGGQMARMINGFFIDKINSNDIQTANYTNLETGLNQSLESLSKEKYSPSLIIIPPEFAYRTNMLKLPGFKPSDNQNVAEDFGSYDGIPITTLFTPELENEVFVLDFASAVKLDIYESTDRVFNRLHLEIKPLSEKEINEIFEKDQQSWGSEAGAESLTKAEIKLKIATSVYLEIWINAHFTLPDVKAIRKFTVNDLSES